MPARFAYVASDSEEEFLAKCGRVQSGTQYKAIDGSSPTWIGVFSAPDGAWLLTYDSLSDPDPSIPRTDGLQPRVAILVKFVHPDAEELERWYKEEHLPMLRATPGWVRSWRYKLGDSDGTVMALHEYTSKESFESAEYKAARSTDWRTKIVNSADIVERRVLEVWKT